MWYLSKSTQSIKAVSLEAVTTDLDFVVVYHSISGRLNYGPQTDIGTIDNVLTTIVPSPAIDTQADIKNIIVTNVDNIEHNVVFYFNDGTDKEIFRCKLLENWQAQWQQETGWQVFDSEGQVVITTIKSGYEIIAGSSNSNPADSLTYYFGKLFGNVSTTLDGSRQMPIFRTGTITKVHLNIVAVGVGTAEQISFYVRVNSTTDYLISSAITMNVVSQSFTITGLNIPIAEGSQIQIKYVCPVWVTNPTAVYIAATLWVE